MSDFREELWPDFPAAEDEEERALAAPDFGATHLMLDARSNRLHFAKPSEGSEGFKIGRDHFKLACGSKTSGSPVYSLTEASDEDAMYCRHAGCRAALPEL